jgi:solute carrier family 13 (sodium-dependent dicarboxylate transporter), member 2/3/5
MTSKISGKGVIVILGIIAFLFFTCSTCPESLSPEGWKLLGVMALIILMWISEVIPFAVIALLPLILFPLLGIAPFPKVTSSYANPVIFLFLGGFLMANALEKTGLHKRLALYIISITGKSFTGILFGFMLSTAILSMWISNTATTVMMTSIALPALQWLLPDADEGTRIKFASFFLVSIAYASGIGGVATIIGTPPNAVLFGLLNAEYNIELSFVGWMAYGLPISVIMFVITFFIYKRKIKPMDLSVQHLDFRKQVKPELAMLGPLRYEEKWVIGIFSLAIALWLTRAWINQLIGESVLDDAMIALFAGVLPFMIPMNRQMNSFIMRWEDTQHLPWNILLLFGGGLSLAAAMGSTGLVQLAADGLVSEFGSKPLLFLLVLPLTMLMLTELMGNVALATLFLPLTFQVAINLELPLQFYAFPVTVASSFAFMLPIATPPNAIVYSKGYFSITFMMKRGVWLNVIGWLVITLVTYLYFFI